MFEGSGFDEEPSNNIVLIGQVGCTVKSATTQNLICEPGLFKKIKLNDYLIIFLK